MSLYWSMSGHKLIWRLYLKVLIETICFQEYFNRSFSSLSFCSFLSTFYRVSSRIDPMFFSNEEETSSLVLILFETVMSFILCSFVLKKIYNWFFLFVLSRNLNNSRSQWPTNVVLFSLLRDLSWRHFIRFIPELFWSICEISWKFSISAW